MSHIYDPTDDGAFNSSPINPGKTVTFNRTHIDKNAQTTLLVLLAVNIIRSAAVNQMPMLLFQH